MTQLVHDEVETNVENNDIEMEISDTNKPLKNNKTEP
jgi:hypothetical protein